MPIVERDPWREQYFAGVACPEDLIVPTDDEHAWELYPQHRWVYNKLLVAESQGLAAAPHGVPPRRFPVFSKPIYNLHGMGVGGRVVEAADELALSFEAGHMWMELLAGEHVSTDVAVIGGEPRWWRHTVAKPLGEGMFDYWTVEAAARPELEAYCGQWLGAHLGAYTGFVNLETLGGRIVEAHLRFADQWVDLYGGAAWVESVVRLYRDGAWRFDDSGRRGGYSVVLFGAHGPQYRHPPPGIVAELLAKPAISSLQITFHQGLPAAAHAMPPGGFRLAIINCWDLEAGLEARSRLALRFWSTPHRLRRRHPQAGTGGDETSSL
ncbi:MAG TPA: hypothetical protein VMT16_09955 [Thermoanaerobaculia bacterium]|nr:hypothetical protein [Thermoanaerobaculia bacterium]